MPPVGLIPQPFCAYGGSSGPTCRAVAQRRRERTRRARTQSSWRVFVSCAPKSQIRSAPASSALTYRWRSRPHKSRHHRSETRSVESLRDQGRFAMRLFERSQAFLFGNGTRTFRPAFKKRSPNQTLTFAACICAANEAKTASIFCASLELSCTHSPRLTKLLP